MHVPRPTGALLALAVLGGACSASTEATTTAAADHSAFCDAAVTTERAAMYHDLEAVVQGMAAMAAASPTEAYRDAVTETARLIEQDPEAAFESASMATTRDLHQELLEAHCGQRSLEVVGVDFAYEGMPAEVASGRALLEFSNGSQENFHEVIVARKKDGVSTQDVLAAGPEGADQTLELVGGIDAAPGEGGRVLLDLVPGDYLFICAVPMDESEDAPMHVEAGMLHEFTVVA